MQRLAHAHRRPQRAEIEAGTHAIRAPELDVVGVVVGLAATASMTSGGKVVS
jgi:hypothetical protein